MGTLLRPVLLGALALAAASASAQSDRHELLLDASAGYISASGDFGAWTGASLRRLARRREWAAVQRHPSGFRFPGGESFVEMQCRIADAVRRLVVRHPGRAIVAVSHADPIKALLAHVLGAPLDLFQRLVVAPASISAVAFRGEGATVLTVNSVEGGLAALAGR